MMNTKVMKTVRARSAMLNPVRIVGWKRWMLRAEGVLSTVSMMSRSVLVVASRVTSQSEGLASRHIIALGKVARRGSYPSRKLLMMTPMAAAMGRSTPSPQ